MTSVDLNENSVTGIPDNIQTVGGKKMHALDDALSDVSENPVQNKAIKAQLDALDSKIDGKTVNVDGLSVMKNTVNNNEVLYAVGYRNVVNNVAKGESFNVSFGGRVPPAGSLTATGLQSHAEGNHPTAEGDYSHAEGYYCTASGTASHTEGNTTVATGNYSHTEGRQVTAYGESSHAEGYGEGAYQSAMGTIPSTLYNIAGSTHFTLALGNYSHAEGESSSALNEASHAEGYRTRALGPHSHTEGSGTSVSNEGGTGAHAEGVNTDAYGPGSHAEGYKTHAVGNQSHAEGSGTYEIPSATLSSQGSSTIIGIWSYGSNNLSVAYGNDSHSEGNGCCATGDQSHAAGYETFAYGKASHSEGYSGMAYGNYSHLEGYSYNKYNPSRDGSSDSDILASFQNYHFSLAKGSSSHVEGAGNIALGDSSHAEGQYNAVLNPHSHVEGIRNIVYSSESHAEGDSNTINSGSNYSHAEGYSNNITNASYAHVEGTDNTITGHHSHAEGYSNNITNAYYAHAEGSENTITGHYAHAEGSHNSASGQYGHVEGYGNAAGGACSHVEGDMNNASGYASHAEGYLNDGKGSYIHIEGYHNAIKEVNNNTLIPGLHISGAFNEISGAFSKGGTLVAGTLNRNLYLGSYAGFVAGCNNYIGSSSFAMGRKLAAGHGCVAIGNWNRRGDIDSPNIKMKYSTDTDDGRHRCYTITDSQDNVEKLVIRLDGLNYDNLINKTFIANLKVNGVDVSSADYSVTMTPPSSDFENYEMIQVYYLIIETANITPAQEYTVYIDIAGYDMSSYPYIFMIGNGVYASDEDCNDQHDANALAVTYNGHLKVQNNITFKYVDSNDDKHRISIRKIVDVLLNMGVSITDLEVSENDM